MPERPLKILLVEDHRETADITAHLLRRYGHEVDIARNGTAAMEALQAPLPDVVLLDIGLPGIDGFQVAEQLRSEPELKHVFIIAISGYGPDMLQGRARRAGFDHHLVKPVDFKTILSLLPGLHRTD